MRGGSPRERSPRRLVGASAMALVATAAASATAAPFVWKGHDWNVTTGGMAGVTPGSPANVTIDGDGYLHLKITNSGGTWTSAELFTTDKLGFGTYQWQVQAPIDRFDKNVVLGLFPYGPAANIGSDGTNEIDIEYSRWGQANGDNGDWTDYPATGKTVGELSYDFTLSGGVLSTSRFIWTSTSIEDFLMTGLQPLGSTAGLLKSWTYAPSTPTSNIPQQALPLGMNLWCFDATPSDGNDVDVVIRDFAFLAEGASLDAGGAAIEDASAGADSSAAAGDGASAAGAGTAADGAAGSSGAARDAGAGSSGAAGAAGAGVDAAGSEARGDASTPGDDSGSGCSCDVARETRAGTGELVLFAVPLLVRRRRSRRPDR
jgi:hypothetical protein